MAYQNHFLTNVILRADFVFPVKQWKTQMPKALRDAALKNFPNLEPRQITNQTVQVDSNAISVGTVVNKELSIEWNFFGKNRKKRLVITADSIFIDQQDYTSFDELKGEFLSVLNKAYEEFPGLIVSRLGLRYINQIGDKNLEIDLNSLNESWNKYINNSLVAALGFTEVDANSVTRVMNTIEMNYGEFMLRYQYGIFNEDYPAIIIKPTFILDSDIYSSGAYSSQDIAETIEKFHVIAKKWFESSIKEPLRALMSANHSE
ncbi:MAG TPA: TIGR04255 family protein [Clostridiales bacterium]|nr:TIGR04255 family protein [Clostridiales bacterium]